MKGDACFGIAQSHLSQGAKEYPLKWDKKAILQVLVAADQGASDVNLSY